MRIAPVKVGTVLMTSIIILLLALAQPVAFNATESGINYTTYTVAGIHVQPLITTLPDGWKVANVTQDSTSGGTSMSYVLESAQSNVSLLVSLSSSPYDTPSIIPSVFSKVTTAGNFMVSNQSLTKYELTANGSDSSTGFGWSAPISYLSGGRVSTGVLSFLASEPAGSYNATGGKDLVAISSSFLDRVAIPQVWSLPLLTIGSPLLEYSSYTIPSAGLAGLLIGVGSLRGREIRDGRIADNAIGLTRDEFSLYATLCRESPLQTAAAYELAAINKGIKWNDFGTELAKLERLGLMSKHVRARGGTPRLLWKCELA